MHDLKVLLLMPAYALPYNAEVGSMVDPTVGRQPRRPEARQRT